MGWGGKEGGGDIPGKKIKGIGLGEANGHNSPDLQVNRRFSHAVLVDKWPSITGELARCS